METFDPFLIKNFEKAVPKAWLPISLKERPMPVLFEKLVWILSILDKLSNNSIGPWAKLTFLTIVLTADAYKLVSQRLRIEFSDYGDSDINHSL